MFETRGWRQVARALVGRQHYITLFNMARLYPRFVENLSRYLTGNGSYPYRVEVRTPTGIVRPTLYSHHDLLTLNEIFCRHDYPAALEIGTVVDIGSNIGISALYFLSRNAHCRCFLFEPYEQNVERLKANLAGYEDRYELSTVAVADRAGPVTFGVEPTGRYGGIGMETGTAITVECRHINDVLADVLIRNGAIDVLKIDTEGEEESTVRAADAVHLRHVDRLYIEAAPRSRLQPEIFEQRQYGSVCQLTNRAPRAAGPG
jgi:FkbM family methyltransferase